MTRNEQPDRSAAEAAPPHRSRVLALARRHRYKLLALTFWLLAIGSYATYIIQYQLTPLDVVQGLVAFFQMPYGPLVYILAFAVRPILLFSATLLTLAGGAIYGPLWGLLLTIVASNTSATVVYTLGHFMGRGILEEYSGAAGGESLVQRYAAKLRRNSFMTVLSLNLMLFLPFDLISYLAGFLRISYRSFILGTFLGSIPGIAGLVFLGASVQFELQDGFVLPRLHPWMLLLAIALFLFARALSGYIKRHEAQREARLAAER